MRTFAGSQSLRRMAGVRGYGGEEWPHSQSIPLEEQGCQEGPPWICLYRSAQAAAGCRWSEGPGRSPSPSFSPAPDWAGRDCGLLAAPGAHTTVGFPAPPPPTLGERLQGGL